MRLFTIARFGVYAVIIAIGVLHLVARGDASTPAEEPRGPWISGRTSQGYAVGARVDGSRIVGVGMGWSARCSNGEPLGAQRVSFDDPRTGRFERRGRRFRAAFGGSAAWADGTLYVLHARVEGTAGHGEAHGTAAFTATYDERGRRVTCESGPIEWSVRR